jgi:hypothetical protein
VSQYTCSFVRRCLGSALEGKYCRKGPLFVPGNSFTKFCSWTIHRIDLIRSSAARSQLECIYRLKKDVGRD